MFKILFYKIRYLFNLYLSTNLHNFPAIPWMKKMGRPLATHCLRLKMNGKKLSQFQFHFPGLLETSPMSKQETEKISIGDNPIYPFW